MQLLVGMYIICLVVGFFFAINFLMNKEKCTIKDYLLALALVFLNAPFLLVWCIRDHVKSSSAKADAKKEEDERARKIAAIRNTLKYYDNRWRVISLKDPAKNKDATACLRLYYLLQEAGYADQRILDDDILYLVYDDFVAPSLINELRAEYAKD